MRWPKINDTWRHKYLGILMRVDRVDWTRNLVHGTDQRTGKPVTVVAAEFASHPCDWVLTYKKPALRASRRRTTADWT